jgi:hypothetical protein
MATSTDKCELVHAPVHSPELAIALANVTVAQLELDIIENSKYPTADAVAANATRNAAESLYNAELNKAIHEIELRPCYDILTIKHEIDEYCNTSVTP